jgi:citrate lyase beta subunit
VAFVVPKVRGPPTSLTLEERLRDIKADPGIVLWAMIESPLGVLSRAGACRAPRAKATSGWRDL